MTSGGSYKKKSIRRKEREELEELEDKVEEEIMSMVEEGHDKGVILEDEAEMISNIFEFADKLARDIMTNRQKIEALQQDISVNEAIRQAVKINFTRFPVYGEDIDEIVGIVHLKDLIAAYLENPDQSIKYVVQNPIFIHPTYDIAKLLKKMKKERLHMAIVVDEYGQTEGLVAMEDIIETIIGDIQDEHDEDEEENIVKKLAGDGYVVSGLMPLDELEELLQDVEFPDSDIETLNGFLLYKLGRLPVEGENIELNYEGYKFTTVEICDKMLKLVKITRRPQEEIDAENSVTE